MRDDETAEKFEGCAGTKIKIQLTHKVFLAQMHGGQDITVARHASF